MGRKRGHLKYSGEREFDGKVYNFHSQHWTSTSSVKKVTDRLRSSGYNARVVYNTSEGSWLVYVRRKK